MTRAHASWKERWAFSASERTRTSRSKRGHQPSARCSRPAAQPAPRLPPPKKVAAASGEGNGTGHESSQLPICAGRPGFGPPQPASTRASAPMRPGCAAAVSIAVWPPMDWPTRTGRSRAKWSMTAMTSAMYAARETSCGWRSEAPCPRWSTVTTRWEGASSSASASHSPPYPANPCSSTTGWPGPPRSRQAIRVSSRTSRCSRHGMSAPQVPKDRMALIMPEPWR